MSVLAAQEIERSAQRQQWEFWKGSVMQALDPEKGLEIIDVVRGVTSLGEEGRQVVFRYSRFGFYAGDGLFSMYPTRRTFEARTTLQGITEDAGWLTEKEFSDLGKAP